MNILYGKLFVLILISFFILKGYSQPPCDNPTTFNCADIISGSQFYMTTTGNVDFTFDNNKDYLNGLTRSGSTQLRLKINEIVPGACKWKLIMYIDNNGYLPNNEWEPLNIYGSSGNNPELNLIQVKVYNGCGTPLNSGIYQIFSGNVQYDILEIIPDLGAAPPNLPGSCDGTPINSAGSYITDYNEFNFNIDYRIIPGYTLKPGAYQIKINFCLVEY